MDKVKQTTTALVLIGFILFLSGCASNLPAKIGFTEAQWESYSPEKQESLAAAYEKFVEERQEKTKDKSDGTLKNEYLEVKVYGGQVMMPPFIDWQEYQSVNFTIAKDQCRDINLRHLTDENTHTELGVCYYGNTLYLDPSHYDLSKKNGTISINSSPLWSSGFVYSEISSSGYTKLKNVTIEIIQHQSHDL